MKTEKFIKERIELIQQILENEEYDSENTEYAQLRSELDALQWVIEEYKY